jgi:hypothetical protein
MMAKPPTPKEHPTQVKVKQWVRECIPAPKTFLAFDRTKKHSARQHINEAARGLRKGTPDTCLMVKPLPAMWVELKRKGEKPDEDQKNVGADIVASGHLWGWVDTVVGYARLIQSWGVPVSAYALLRAEHHDLVLAGEAITASINRPPKKRTSRPRAPKPSAAAVARGHRMTVRP